MTEQEKTEILDELEARFDKKYKGCLSKEDTQSILKEPRNKWFRDAQGSCSNSLMADAFDNSIIAWQVWENIRKLTCVICGKQYGKLVSYSIASKKSQIQHPVLHSPNVLEPCTKSCIPPGFLLMYSRLSASGSLYQFFCASPRDPSIVLLYRTICHTCRICIG